MPLDIFKKITYVLSAVAIILVSYLAFIRKTNSSNSASSRNAKFLGLKASPSNTTGSQNVGNQKELSIDTPESTTKTTDSTAQTQSMTNSVTSNGKPASLYTVKEGDTYGCIAESYYGSYEHWPDILNANAKYGTGFSEHQLHVGAVLELPAVSAELLKPASKLCS